MADDQQHGNESRPGQPKAIHALIITAGLLCVAGSIFYGFREYGFRMQQQVDAMYGQTAAMDSQQKQKIYDDKMTAFKRVTEAASKIAALKAGGENATQVQDAVAQFKTLAWGPAAINEGPDSNAAIALFNRGVDAGADAGQLQRLSVDLAKVCGNEARDGLLKVHIHEGVSGHELEPPPSSPVLLQEMQTIVRGPESQQAALQWLSLIDGGQFEQSWKTASQFFQLTIPQERWVRAMGSVRTPYGSMMSRKMVKADYARKAYPPGAPESDSMDMEFDTAFSVRGNAAEFVTMVFDHDGQWRAAAYSVK